MDARELQVTGFDIYAAQPYGHRVRERGDMLHKTKLVGGEVLKDWHRRVLAGTSVIRDSPPVPAYPQNSCLVSGLEGNSENKSYRKSARSYFALILFVEVKLYNNCDYA